MAQKIVSVRLPSEKVARLKQLAARRKQTLTDVVEESVDRTLAEAQGQDSLKALSYAIGQCASGGGDVSTMSLGPILEKKLRDRTL